MAIVVYLLNISPTKAVMNKTPYEAWRGMKPLGKHLKYFDYIAYTLIHSQSLKRHVAKSEKCIFVGYCNESKAYKLYNLTIGSVIISKNVISDENACRR